MPNPTIKKNFTVRKGDFVLAGDVSTQVKTLLKQIGFENDFIRRTAIAMYEGEINMVIHANGGEVLVEIYDDSVVVKLKDVGPGIKDIPQAMEEGFSTASEEARALGFGAGMGLSNMERNTDEMYIESDIGVGTTVTLVIKA